MSRILVVDDDPLVCMAIQIYLVRRGLTLLLPMAAREVFTRSTGQVST